jgi:ABC-2 type transport system ATP-binding protein
MNNLLLQVKNLKKYFHEKHQVIKALDDVSLQIFKGEVLGLLGVNGAGKTTLSSIIATLHPPTEGDIIYNEKSIYADINEYRRIIGFCPQKPNLNNDLTVEQNLLFAGRFYGLPESVVKDRYAELVEKYDLGKYLKSSPDILSGGYKQRVVIARALMPSPKLVILDEPTVGLDPHIRHGLWENIRELKDKGVTVILTTHYLDEAEILSDRICILDKGVVRLVDTPENLKTTYHRSRLEDVFLELMREDNEK